MDGQRIVVVAGASTGIGLEAAIRFAARGDTVVAGVRNESRTEGVRRAATEAGVELDVVAMDVVDDASVTAAFDDIQARHGRVDVLVANAGTGSVGTLEEHSLESLRATMEVNFYGVVRVTKAVLPGMRERRSGRLIAVTSVGGAMGQPFNDAYCAAKFAVEGLYESLNPVVSRFGIHASIVEPGPVATDFQRKSSGAERDSLDVDGDPYGELFAGYRALMSAGESRKQPTGDAAQVIVDVAAAEAPLLRYQTSSFTRRLIGMKLADLDGSAITGFTGSWLDAPR
jgi:NAD(P)-dependent dehydrogenase (short-subunit alcohol dehydrogenase family)